MEPSANTNDDEALDFFDVFLPRTNGQKLLIPPAFKKNFKGKVPNKVTLQDLCGRCWQADIKETKDGLFIDNGWEQFVTDKSVELGSFFVLRYVESSSSFVVKIFDPTTGIKTEDFDRVKTEEEGAQEQTHNAMKCTESIRARHEHSSERVKQFDSPSSRLRNDNKRKFVESVEHSPARNPRCRVNYRPSTPYTVLVSKRILDKHNITLNQHVDMQDEYGKVWPLSISHGEDGRTNIRGGWKEYLNYHKLNPEKDVLDLEFIRPASTRFCKELKVHVLKRVSPRGRGRPRKLGGTPHL